jgi:hypothetical protein
MARSKLLLGCLFVGVLLYNSLGGFALWQVQYKQVRRGVKQALLAGVPDESLTKFVFSQVYYDQIETEPGEFRYQGKMYDVVRITQRDGYLHILCLADIEEDQLNERLGSLLSEQGPKVGTTHKKGSKGFGQLQYLATSQLVIPEVVSTEGDFLLEAVSTVVGSTLVFSPPPETGYLYV